jgi:predicted acyl esterase
LMVSGDIFRGRYREDLEKAKPIAANEVLEYTLSLPHVNHTFKAGHRLMVQIQSTWFPLYDLNPQTFVPSIMVASKSAYKPQQHRVHHGAKNATYIEFRKDGGE